MIIQPTHSQTKALSMKKTPSARSAVLRAVAQARELLGDVPLQQLHVLLLVDAYGPVPMTELQRISKMTKASLSRTVAQLGQPGYWKEGYGLLKQAEDLTDRRHKVVSITKDGHAMVAAICGTIH